MFGLMNYNPGIVADPQRQGFGAVDPMGAMMGLMAINQAFGKKPRYTTSLSEASAPDDSGMQTAMGLMNYQRQAQRDKLASEQLRRQQALDALKVDEYQRGVTKEKEWADAAASGDQARMMEVYKRHDPKGWWASQQKDETPLVVAPGSTVLDKRTGQPTFTAPAKPENEPEHLRLMRAAGIDPGSPQGKQMLTGYLNSKGDKPTNELYYDPNSPTGTRYARSNLPGPPSSGIDVEMGPDGKVARLRQGPQMPGAGGAGLEKTVRGDNQKQMLSLGERMMELNQIEQRFQPQFHQWGTRLGGAIKDLRDVSGIEAAKLSPQEAQSLNDLRGYQATVGKTMSGIRHEMFGSALTKTETGKADEYIINADDSPTTAQAKLRSFKDLTTKAMARRKYADANGLNWEEVPLDKMPQVIRERGDYLAKLMKMKDQGADDSMIRESVKRQLALEFGFMQ